MSGLRTFLGFEEALEAVIISASMIFITLVFLLNTIDLVSAFFVCLIESILFFIFERNYVRKEVLKLLLASLFYLVFSLASKYLSINLLNKGIIYASYIALVLFLSRNSFYLAFPSFFSSLKVFEKDLEIRVTNFLNHTRSAYLRLKKILFQRRLSEREALKLSQSVLVNYLKNEKKLEVLSKSMKNFSASTLAKDKNSFLFLFREKNLEFMVAVDRVSRKVSGPLLVPSLKQLSFALSKHFGLNLRVVNLKYVSFGTLWIGFDNNKGVYYEGTFDLVRKKLKLNNAFLSYKFFLTNYESSLILEDIKRIDNFKFEIIYSKDKEKHSDFVDVSNVKNVIIEKKN